MKLSEFFATYDNPTDKWDFNKFKIHCVKCDSTECEFNGEMEDADGYYGHSDIWNKIVVKCHGCGNAFAMMFNYEINGDYCNHDD